MLCSLVHLVKTKTSRAQSRPETRSLLTLVKIKTAYSNSDLQYFVETPYSSMLRKRWVSHRLFEYVDNHTISVNLVSDTRYPADLVSHTPGTSVDPTKDLKNGMNVVYFCLLHVIYLNKCL